MEEQIKQNWWKRNWKWALPAGGCLTIICIGIAFVSYGVYTVADKLSEETSVFALFGIIQEVQQSPEVRESLGMPIEFNGLKNGEYDPEKDKNNIDLDFEIQGKKSDGTLRVVGEKTDDGWQYSTFTVTVKETGEIIDLKDQANE